MNHVDRVSGQVVDAAVKLHMRLGPGLMESVYVGVLAQELVRRGLSVQQQKSLRFEIDGVVFPRALRPDLVVDGVVVVEVKSVEVLAPVHSKQVLTYLRCLGLSVGLLLNFGAPTMKQGLLRVVNDYRVDRTGRLPQA